jgi:hypothetical protein
MSSTEDLEKIKVKRRNFFFHVMLEIKSVNRMSDI